MEKLISQTEPTNSGSPTELGRYVRQLREERGWSLRDTARRAEVDATWLGRVEQGIYESPDARALLRLARALGVDVEELYVAAGLTDGRGLPSFAQYLRRKYDLPQPAIEQLEAHFNLLNDKHLSEGETHANTTFPAT